ncbi:flavin reductase family protein [Streptomyces canus]|uniref:flavin reductase family protein n=1 Tax=Streptomyces canus TaxID=58343 RepID=UPI00035FC71A|nr:flavin reductase family protein [Streptomyces canus]
MTRDTPYINDTHPTPEVLRRTFGTFPSGVVALCGTTPEGETVGMAISAFIPVSLDPPLIGVATQNSSRTWAVLRELPSLGVSVLASDQQLEARQLAAREGDRFTNIDLGNVTEGGAVFLANSVSRFDCVLESETPAGDHTMVLLRIRALSLSYDVPPLVFHESAFATLSPLGEADIT